MRESRTWKMIIRYSRGEEVFNMVSHIAGGGLAAAITALCVIKASFSQQVLGIVGTSVYGAMLVIYYSISSIYHGLAPRIGAKKVFRSLDGCAEFLLCAGTNTLFAFGVIGKASTALGWTYFGIIWGIAVTGILFNAFDPDKFKIVSVVLYLVIWWSLTAAVPI
ncbi:MAG TPA: hemolysin III family protein, partial [Lachnospiraceae bacterium]|nr:hemolysin III family protein [Lachnospiraceae bacterium]